ncbi:MAG: hypothetical protein Q8M99_09190 [Methylotenera sp.]|nr:hypothetical protein [Methylotenera sp.]
MLFKQYCQKMILLLLCISVLAGCATQSVQKPPHIERISEEELQRIMVKPVTAISLEEIVVLSNQGVAPAAIIEKIKASNSYYPLSPTQTLELSKQGVSSEVLDYMYSSHDAKVRNNVAEEINKRERQKVEEVERIRREQRLMRAYDPFWMGPRFGRFGYGPFGPGFGWGGGFGHPLGWW